MPTYPTLDHLPDLPSAAMSGAGRLVLEPFTPSVPGIPWDHAALVTGNGVAQRTVFRFDGIAGATYDIFSTSSRDPTRLTIYDASGNAVVANDEGDDLPIVLGGAIYEQDVVFEFVAPVSGVFYVDASWNQSAGLPFHAISVYEDRDTAPANRAPRLATPLTDLTWTEGRAHQSIVPAAAFADPDGSGLVFAARQADGAPLPAWLRFDAVTRTLSGTPPTGAGDVVVRITATDPGGLSASDDLVVRTPAAAGGAGMIVSGTDRDDTLTGGPGDDRLHGGKGDDRIDGGSGTDTAVYGGRFADYVVGFDSASGSYTVRHLSATGDGVDTVRQVEFFEFADGRRAAGSLGATAGRTIDGTAADDDLIGSGGNDVLRGNDGDDRLTGSGGNDTLHGGKGLDVARFTGPLSQYTVTRDPASGAIVIADETAGRDGRDTLDGVERLRFSDLGLAFDLDGAAGDAARMIGATLGPDFLDDPGLIGAVLFYLDAGAAYDELGSVIFEALGTTDPRAVVGQLWTNVVGTAPTPAQAQPFIDMLRSGTTVGELSVLAAETDLNAQRIDLVGLTAEGLPFALDLG